MGDPGEASVSENHVVEHSVPPVAHVEAIVLAVCLPILGIVSKGPEICIRPLPSHLKDRQDLHSTSFGSHATTALSGAQDSQAHGITDGRLRYCIVAFSSACLLSACAATR